MSATDESPSRGGGQGHEPRGYQQLAPTAPEGAIDLEAWLSGEGPLELDVGFGRGLSLLERAAAAPHARLLGIEVRSKWTYKVMRRLEREGLAGRVRVVCGNARDIVHRAGPPGCVARAFVHFPDPWWKKRHAKRRMIVPAFVDDVARLLAPGGELFIQTDVEERAASYRQLLDDHDGFELAGEGGYVDHNPYGARSNRERRAEQDGLPVWRLLATRRSP